jgi:hypothetical protein
MSDVRGGQPASGGAYGRSYDGPASGGRQEAGQAYGRSPGQADGRSYPGGNRGRCQAPCSGQNLPEIENTREDTYQYHIHACSRLFQTLPPSRGLFSGKLESNYANLRISLDERVFS